MDADMSAALLAFSIGKSNLVQVRQVLLRHFPGRRTPSDTLLLSDYLDDLALRVRDGSLEINQAVADLIEVRASEDARRNSLSNCRLSRPVACHAA